MREHVLLMRAEDYDDFDESQVEFHEGHAVTMALTVPVDSPDFELLSDIAKRDGKTIIDAAQDAVHAYVIARTRRAAS